MKYTFEHAIKVALAHGACGYAIDALNKHDSWESVRQTAPWVQRCWARWFIFHVIMDDASHALYKTYDAAWEAESVRYNAKANAVDKRYDEKRKETTKAVKQELKIGETLWTKVHQDKLSKVAKAHERAERAVKAAHDKRVEALHLKLANDFYDAYCC